MEARPPESGGRSNKLKEERPEGEGVGRPEVGLELGWKTVNTCDTLTGPGGAHRFRSLFMKQQVMVLRMAAPVTRATAAPTSRGMSRVSRACR